MLCSLLSASALCRKSLDIRPFLADLPNIAVNCTLYHHKGFMEKLPSTSQLLQASISLHRLLTERGVDTERSKILALLKDTERQDARFSVRIAEILRSFGFMVQEYPPHATQFPEIGELYRCLEDGSLAILHAHEFSSLLSSASPLPPLLWIKGSVGSFLSGRENEVPVRNHHPNEGEHHHLSAGQLLQKLWRLIRQERKDISVVIIYSIIMGLLSLIVPLSSQAIVNAVALGVYTSQLVVLCAGVGAGLLILGVFNVLEMYVVDVLRRRIFVRTAFDIAYRLPRIKAIALEGEYAPELVNRFFDVITVTKSLGKFLLDGISAALVALIGLVLLAVYHPFFLLFDIFLMIFLILLVAVLGRGGLKTSIKESKKKYAVANWLEEIARCQQAFKLNADDNFAFQRLDAIAEEYVRAHRSHFIVIARQVAGSSFFRSVATVGVLGLGGMLVIERQLSLGQLVAAELVIISLLASIEKLITQFEDFYDLLTGLDKLSSITDKEVEEVGGEHPDFGHSALEVHAENLRFSYPNNHTVLDAFSLHIPAGARVSIVGENGSGKTTFAELLMGLHETEKGSLRFNGYELRRLSLPALRHAIGTVSRENDVFEGSIEENITMGRTVSYAQLQRAISVAGMEEDIRLLKKGLATHVLPSGTNLPYGLVRRIVLARCILCNPRLIILDEAFDGVERATKLAIIERLYAQSNCTILDISHDEDLVRRADIIFTMKNGSIAEQGSLEELVARHNSEFRQLFPDIQTSATKQ